MGRNGKAASACASLVRRRGRASPAGAEAGGEVLAFVPLGDAGAVDDGDAGCQSEPAIVQECGPQQHDEAAGELHGVGAVAIDSAGNEALGRVVGDGCAVTALGKLHDGVDAGEGEDEQELDGELALPARHVEERRPAGAGAGGEGDFREKEEEEHTGESDLHRGAGFEVFVLERPAGEQKGGEKDEGDGDCFSDKPVVTRLVSHPSAR